MSQPRPSLALELIRASTAAVHRTLESSLEIARPDAGEAAYLRYLEALVGWLEPLERELWLGPWPEPLAVAARAGKCAWIEADLRARGRGPDWIARLPRQHALPPLGSLAQRFGVAYVVEGAQLGGQHLLRRLGPRIAPLPARWLEGYGRLTARRWGLFVSALGVHVAEPGEAEAAARTAQLTFELAHAWLSARGAA